MTVATSTAKSGPYAGSGTTGPFTVGFRFLENAHIQVIRTSSTGVDTTLALTTDYTVTGAGGASGSVTLVAALAVGQQLTIVRNVPFTQDADYVQNDAFPAESHERALDKLTMQTQQLLEAVNRAAKLPVTSTEDSDALVANITLLADNIASIEAVNGNLADITTVANDLNEPVSEIETVAGSIANVNTVSANIANVNTVAGISANVTTVATNIASVNSAASNMAAIIAAPSEAAAAAASAAAAAASAASGMYSSVQDKSANYTVVAPDAGDLIRVTTTGGNITITLPAISTQADGFKVAIVKWSGDANTVTVARSGSDTINGAISYNLASQYNSATFVADFETAQWFAVASGIGTTNVVVDRFNGTGAQTAFTLAGSPGSINNTYVFVGGVYQQKNTYSLSGTTLTFSAAPPSGTGNIEVVWTQPLAIGVPSDGTVSTAKIQDGAVATAKIQDAAVTTAKIANLNVTPAKFSVDAQYSMQGFRNRIINGDMRIDQRNNGASGTANGYTVDRFAYFGSQASKGTWQRNAGSVTPPASFTNYLGFTSSSAYTVGSTEEFELYQSVEGLNVADLGWGTASAQTVTLSFWVRSSLTGTFGGSFTNSGGSRSYPFSYTISAANTWELETITIPGDTTGTWLTTNGIGIAVNWGLGVGSTKSGTAGAWAGSYFTSATGATSVVGTNGATFYITGVQLEAGSVASPFERIDYGRQLIQCQRYYQRFFFRAYQYSPSVDSFYSTVTLPVVMRASPTFSLGGTWTATNVSAVNHITTPNSYTIGITPIATAMCGYASSGTSEVVLTSEP